MRFVRGLQDVFNKFARYGENLLGFLGKTFGCESAGDAHLFIICARPGEVFAGVKGGALFCALDKSRRGVIIVGEKGTLRQAVDPVSNLELHLRSYRPTETVTCRSGGFCF